MNLKKIYRPVLSIVYGIYNSIAIMILAFLFISQRTWNPKGTKRKIKATI